ncbi:hypothetical protein Hanom_Chr11g01060531 [Helianthus anomalus]
MNYRDYSPAPSATTFERSTSFDLTKNVNYVPEPTAPSFASVLNGHSEPDQLTATSQYGVPPVLSDVRPIMKSAYQISDRGLNSTSFGGQAPGRSGAVHVHNITSVDKVTSKDVREAKAPTMTDIAERERSNKGESDQQDHVRVSMVGKKFKPVNPEAYDVEDDDEY